MSRTSFTPRSYPFLHTDEIADALNRSAGRCIWTSQKVRRWLKRNQAAVKCGFQWCATPDTLREHIPQMWAQILPYIVTGDSEDEDDAA